MMKLTLSWINNSFPKLGDLWKIDSKEIQKTLKVVKGLIKRRGEDMTTNTTVFEENMKLKRNVSELEETVQQLKKEKNSLKKDK